MLSSGLEPCGRFLAVTQTADLSVESTEREEIGDERWVDLMEEPEGGFSIIPALTGYSMQERPLS